MTAATTPAIGTGVRRHRCSSSDVHTYYGNIHALQGIDLEVDEGEIVTLIGANGAGKTTTLQARSPGLLQPAQGDGRASRARTSRRSPPHELVEPGIGHAPEGRRIFSRLTVLENLEMGGYTRRPARDRRRHRARLRLFPRLTRARRPERRHAVGRRAADAGHRPRADGPAPAPAARRAVARPRAASSSSRSSRSSARSTPQGTTILLVEQNALLALAIAHRGYVLQTGESCWRATPQELAGNETGPQGLPRRGLTPGPALGLDDRTRRRTRPARPARQRHRRRAVATMRRLGASAGVPPPGGPAALAIPATPRARDAALLESAVRPSGGAAAVRSSDGARGRRFLLGVFRAVGPAGPPGRRPPRPSTACGGREGRPACLARDGRVEPRTRRRADRRPPTDGDQCALRAQWRSPRSSDWTGRRAVWKAVEVVEATCRRPVDPVRADRLADGHRDRLVRARGRRRIVRPRTSPRACTGSATGRRSRSRTTGWSRPSAGVLGELWVPAAERRQPPGWPLGGT